MDFQEKIEDRIHEMKHWIHNHLHGHNHGYHMRNDLNHFTNKLHWLYITKFLPKELNNEIHTICIQEHEKFLNEYFKSAKKIKELDHKMDTLKLDIAEHWHLKKNDFDKKVVSESLAELKKVKQEMTNLITQEKNRFNEAKKSAEEKIYHKIQEFLKK